MPGRGDRNLPAWLVGSGVIAVAIGLMNLGTYGFTIVAARMLVPAEYGALAALMGVLLIVNVASLGLQATAARRVSATPEHTPQIEADIMAASVHTALALGALCLVASPLLSAALDLDSWSTAALLALTVVPLTMMGGQAGILQGEQRWLPLALIYLSAGLGRLLFGTLALAVERQALGAMVGVALGSFLPTLVGWAALRHPSRGSSGSGRAPRSAPMSLVGELAHNSHALLAFFALSNADVIVARSVLGADEAGFYAAGLILTKAVLFLPQFVVVVAFPSMARPETGARTHLRGLAIVLAIGVVTTLGVALLSPLAVLFVGGQKYAGIEPQLWAFAVLGTVLALLQLMVYAVVARQDQRSAFIVWGACGAVVVAAQLVSSLSALLTVVVVVDVALLLVLLLRVLGSGLPQEDASTPTRV